MGQLDPHRRAVHYQLDRLAREDAAAAAAEAGVEERAAGDGGAGDRRAGTGSEGAAGLAPDQRPPGGPRPTSWAARGSFADELVRQAIARGEFDNLPLAGKPIPGLTGRHDPDWWLKAFIEREQISGVLPEALQLRKDDAAFDDRLDREHTEGAVRETVAEFNARIVEARRQLRGGPPVVTPLRDVEREVVHWRARRDARLAEAAADAAARAAQEEAARRERRRARAWWRRG